MSIRRIDLINQINKPVYVQRFREITITNNESSALTDFQVPIEIGGDFLDKADPNNLFLVDSGNVVYPYWVEEWKRPTGKARIWTKVDLVASGSKTLKLYYQGIAGDNPPNGDDVFEFFDDFDGDELDSSKWSSGTISGVTQTVENSQLKISGTSSGSGYSYIAASDGIVSGDCELWAKARSKDISDQVNQEVKFRVTGNDWATAAFRDVSGSPKWRKQGKHGGTNYTAYDEDRFKNETKFMIRRVGSEVRSHYWDSFAWQEIGSVYTGFSTSDTSVTIGSYYNSAESQEVYWDWVLYKKYTANEPSVTVGSEQVAYR